MLVHSWVGIPLVVIQLVLPNVAGLSQSAPACDPNVALGLSAEQRRGLKEATRGAAGRASGEPRLPCGLVDVVVATTGPR